MSREVDVNPLYCFIELLNLIFKGSYKYMYLSFITPNPGAIQFNSIIISWFHLMSLRHSQNTFINIFNIKTKNGKYIILQYVE